MADEPRDFVDEWEDEGKVPIHRRQTPFWPGVLVGALIPVIALGLWMNVCFEDCGLAGTSGSCWFGRSTCSISFLGAWDLSSLAAIVVIAASYFELRKR